MISFKFRVVVLTCILSFSSLLVLGQDVSKISSASLHDLSDQPVRLILSEKMPTVFLLLGTDCPITQKYIPTIENLKKSFNGAVRFIGIFPKQYSAAEVEAFVKEYNVSFPCYVDHQMDVIGMLEATITPEAFLLSPLLDILYAGAIDNWFYKLGSYRTKVTKHYLADAIRGHLAGSRITTTRTNAIGCPIPGKESTGDSTSHSHH